jgi:ATP/maltotriose-dependent transcriptional regulator MalT
MDGTRCSGRQVPASSILIELLERQNRAVVLWNPDGQLTWISSAAQANLQGCVQRADLECAAGMAHMQLRRVDAPAQENMLGRPLRLSTSQGRSLWVEFYSVVSEDRRPWLVAELWPHSETRERLASLTPAETRVLCLLTQGLSNREISARLHVSIETIKTHVQRVLAKLRVKSRSKAAHSCGQIPGTTR